MLTPEKMFEIMNPLRLIEAAGKDSPFDVKAQVQRFEETTQLAFQRAGAIQAQARKAAERLMALSEAVLQDQRRLVSDWTAALLEVGSELSDEVQVSLSEAARAPDLLKSGKATRAA